MKNILLTLFIILAALKASAQSNIKFDKIIRDSVPEEDRVVRDVMVPPDEFVITNAEFVDGVMKSFTYLPEMFDSTFTTTLIIYKKNKTDSVLVVQNTLDKYTYTKRGSEWYVKSFDIRSTRLTLNHLAVGLTSMEVFKILKVKSKKQVGSGEIWVGNQGHKTVFFVFFAKNRVYQIMTGFFQ